jgi:Fe-S-cluster containining protein
MKSACCRDFDILPLDLFFPSRMSPEGRAFVETHGIDNVELAKLREGAQDLGNGLVKIQHTCQFLSNDGKCTIYETRPQICRTYTCGTRKDCDCACGGNCG